MSLTESKTINKAIRASEREFEGCVVVVFQKENGDFLFCLESEFCFDDENIRGKYLNGKLCPV